MTHSALLIGLGLGVGISLGYWLRGYLDRKHKRGSLTLDEAIAQVMRENGGEHDSARELCSGHFETM